MKVVVVKEKSAGNDSVGEMWLETYTFDSSTSLGTVLAWIAKSNGENEMREVMKHGRLMLCADSKDPTS